MQALAKMAQKMGQKVGLVSEAPKDEQLEKFKLRLTRLKDMVAVLRKNFEGYAESVVKMSQLSCAVSKDVTQFYSKSPGRTKSVQSFANAHFALDSTTYQIFTDDFGWEVLKVFDDWNTEVDKVLENIQTTEKMRLTVFSLRESVTATEARESSLTPSQKKALDSSRADLAKSNQLYAKMYAALKAKVDRLVDERFAYFDQCFVRLMECQRDFFSAGMKLSESFGPAISNYRKIHPKGKETHGAGGPNQKKGPRPPPNEPKGNAGTNGHAEDGSDDEDIAEKELRAPSSAPAPPPRGTKQRRGSKDDSSVPDKQEKLTVNVHAAETAEKRRAAETAKQKAAAPVDVMGLDDFFSPSETSQKAKGKKGPSFASEEEIAAEEAVRSTSDASLPPRSVTVDLFDMGGIDDALSSQQSQSQPRNNVPQDLLQRQNTLDSLFNTDDMPAEPADMRNSNSLASGFVPSSTQKKSPKAQKRGLAPPDDPFNMFDPLSGQNTPEEPASPEVKGSSSNQYDGQVDSHEFGDLLGSGAEKAKKANKRRQKTPEQLAAEKADYLKNRRPGESQVEYASRKGAEEAIGRARALEEKKEHDADARRDLEDTVGQELNKWKTKDGVPRQMAVLLTSMHSVLWADSGWQSPSLADLMGDPRKLKKTYMKSTLILHPDRQPPNASPRRQLVSRFLFEALNEAKEREGI